MESRNGAVIEPRSISAFGPESDAAGHMEAPVNVKLEPGGRLRGPETPAVQRRRAAVSGNVQLLIVCVVVPLCRPLTGR